ncbi:organic hydroperoxide resistance protein [Streptomyces clavuligerus]|uniref:OsmC family protein n=1 Tax=Streptomyces clavuligerus TaxID=1901 RepID=B5H201_STRCL|nr:organic hydroperoxide resistance protein [Streptomyces clavuligerus]ANW17558.1 Ohr subfamily peroxiredoxin [Streptomyces clavuligerus]AXU12104.1 organic hydroperoxide resistance protein [Streptomyces clavuligerus]EDY52597.1 organic hydroperoxide resistance protein [Streptomyces clavuligerus]EFG09936.1 OsmC family protein [Streptomyces clavuligerus]MBY6301968.1 organic hydroperoxide resistance protein [Streptomyces clavuligerus]
MDALYTAVATATGRDGRAVSSDGTLDLPLALPQVLGGSGRGTNPEQLFAAGYAACFASAMATVARQEKIDVSEVAVTAEVGIGKDAEDGGFALSVVIRAELPDHLQGGPGRALLEKTHAFCPYSKATRGNIPVELVIE